MKGRVRHALVDMDSRAPRHRRASRRREQLHVTFQKGLTRPTAGFWSIDKGWWFVFNALNKFTVSPRDNPKPNADGSLTLYFQNVSPANYEKRLAGALFITPALRHVEDAIPAPTSKRSRSG